MTVKFERIEKSKRLIHLERDLSILNMPVASKALQVVNVDMTGPDFLRHDGSPYVSHIYDVTLYLMNSGYKKPEDEDLIAASIYHDHPEDVEGSSLKLIEHLANSDVAYIVGLVTKEKGVDYHTDYVKKQEYFDRILEDARAIKLKISDRVCNLTTMEHSSLSHRIKQVKETKEWYLPLIEVARKTYVQDEAFFYQAEAIIKPLIAEYERYFVDMEDKDREIADLKEQLEKLQNNK